MAKKKAAPKKSTKKKSARALTPSQLRAQKRRERQSGDN